MRKGRQAAVVTGLSAGIPAGWLIKTAYRSAQADPWLAAACSAAAAIVIALALVPAWRDWRRAVRGTR